MQSATPDNANPVVHTSSNRRTKRSDGLDFSDDEAWSKLGSTASSSFVESGSEEDGEDEIDREEIFG